MLLIVNSKKITKFWKTKKANQDEENLLRKGIPSFSQPEYCLCLKPCDYSFEGREVFQFPEILWTYQCMMKCTIDIKRIFWKSMNVCWIIRKTMKIIFKIFIHMFPETHVMYAKNNSWKLKGWKTTSKKSFIWQIMLHSWEI